MTKRRARVHNKYLQQQEVLVSTRSVSTLSDPETTPSTIEVAHFRYFASDRRGFSSPNRRNANLDFETKRFLDSGHGIIRRDVI